MRIAVISDVHLGDPAGKLVREGGITETYAALREAVRGFTGGRPLDFLVLNGDILDFSIRSFAGSCRIARPFFTALQRDGIAREIVYLPGNHDKHVWDAVEWETGVIRRLADHSDPRDFRRTQPGVIDLASGELVLPGVSRAASTGRYGTLFLEGLFAPGGHPPVAVAYPNLYLRGAGESLLVTHGHMLEPAWVLVSELLAGDPAVAGGPGVAELEEWNVPVTALLCTALGQAGRVSDLVREIQAQAREGESARLREALRHVVPNLESMIHLAWPFEGVDDLVLEDLGRVAAGLAEHYRPARYDRVFFEREEVRGRFGRFYRASCAQAGELGVPPPRRVLFGHTHEPIPARAPMRVADPGLPGGGDLLLFNSGGWLAGSDRGAEVFLLDESGELDSVNLR